MWEKFFESEVYAGRAGIRLCKSLFSRNVKSDEKIINNAMNMKNLKSGFFLIASISLIFLLSCSKEVTNSLWHNKDIIQEKESGDLETPLRFFDPKSRLQYTVLNDNENLYICVKAMEDQTQLKLMRSGLQIWIDSTGRSKKSINISYPLPGEDSNTSSRQENKQGTNQDKNMFHNQFLLAHTDMMITGFKPPMNGLIPIENRFGIAVNIHWDSLGTMVYKARIPFHTFYHESLNAHDLKKTFSITLIVPPLARNTNGRNGSSGTRGGGGGMRGGMGGGMRGGMGGGMGGMRGGGRSGGGYNSGGSSNLSEETAIKLNLRLALNFNAEKNK